MREHQDRNNLGDVLRGRRGTLLIDKPNEWIAQTSLIFGYNFWFEVELCHTFFYVAQRIFIVLLVSYMATSS